MRPALGELYGNRLRPEYQRAQVIAVDCQRLMNPDQPQPSDAEFQTLLSLVEEELKDARKGYELELDAQTITGAACLAELATRREEQWFYDQGERLRRALDRAKAMTPKFLKMLGLADASSQTKSARARQVGLQRRAARRNRAKTRRAQSRS